MLLTSVCMCIEFRTTSKQGGKQQPCCSGKWVREETTAACVGATRGSKQRLGTAQAVPGNFCRWAACLQRITARQQHSNMLVVSEQPGEPKQQAGAWKTRVLRCYTLVSAPPHRGD